ncbi:MAG: 2Fe-2S iron-sulfur cluster-binding protein [Desulfobacterales bacterium]|nr:2Fe-2S iron-sulfur cluster-binding protein [Desulfobacterales bacterium]
MMVKLIVNKQELKVDEGKTLLQACLDNGIYIPNLCHIHGTDNPSASCRLCFVEIEGEDKPISSCTVKAKDGIIVKTDTPSVRRLQRTAFKLLMSVHRVDCGHCPANKKCELQRIAKFLKVSLKPKGLEQRLKEPELDEDHPFLNYYPNRCVLCGKCVIVCKDQHGRALLTFAKRGLDTVVSSYGEKDVSTLSCDTCLACIQICPVSAITSKNSPSKTD